MSRRTEGRQNVRKFIPGGNVRVVNHINKKKWDFGIVVREIAPRSYLVKIGQREVKRYIDDIDVDHSLVNGREYNFDDSWMYAEADDDLSRLLRNSPRNSTRYTARVRASTRSRRAVDRYGMVSYQ